MKSFTQVNVRSIYDTVQSNPIWFEFKEFLVENSESSGFERIKLEEEFSEDAGIGGFAETILVDIAFKAAYDTGKFLLLKILEKLNSAVTSIKYFEGNPPLVVTELGNTGNVEVIARFPDSKEVRLELEFPLEGVQLHKQLNIETVDSKFIQGKVRFYFNSINQEFAVGSLYDFQA